jgi:DNA-directed RNA polymerase subunit RPC12/RpoP
MEALDGNAIAGRLMEVFGVEMTTARGKCASCGASAYVAELRVYLEAPGTVARCRTCGSIVMVLVEIRGVTCVDLRGLAELGPAPRSRT